MDYFHSKRYLDTLPDWETGRPYLGPMEGYLPRMRQLLKRLGDPQESFHSVIVGGSNGKGTVASLIAAIFKASGFEVGLYTQPHLHTLRERIQVQGALIDRDGWSEATSFFYDQTREFEKDGHGVFSKFEAVTALAAHFFRSAGVQYGVFEVGLGGRYDATNAWDSELAVVTPIVLDHVEVLGNDLLKIAAEKVCVSRAGKTLLTTPLQDPSVLAFLRSYCDREGVTLRLSDSDEVGVTDVNSRVADQRRPRFFLENANLALNATRILLGGRLDYQVAHPAIRSHYWPGRFEEAKKKPYVLLDGAHNPAAANTLAANLRQIAPNWTFVVGVNHGHDAGGILSALEPVAERVILTSSDHPKALNLETLERGVPATLDYVKINSWTQAFRQAIDSLDREKFLCITGSLHLVARAREYFNLPLEREGISEEVPLESLTCIAMASQRCGYECERATDNDNVFVVRTPRRPLYFLRNKHPFNDYVSARLAEDKGYQYELFRLSGLPTPSTAQIFNPFADDRFNRYKNHQSIDEAVDDIELRFSYPVLVKRHRSSVSQGVFLEHDRKSMRARMQILFENSGQLDNILLIQSYIRGPEFRLVASQGELLLAYEKQCEEDLSKGDLNPLHQSSGSAVKVIDTRRLRDMEELTRRVSEVIDLGFYAIDLIDGPDGYSILELNPNPFCYFYNRDNGREDFVSIYAFLFEKYVAICGTAV